MIENCKFLYSIYNYIEKFLFYNSIHKDKKMFYQDNRMIPEKKCRLLLANEYEDKKHVRFHSHDGAEMIFMESGSCSIEIGSRTLKGEPGDLFLIPYGIEHNQINYGNVQDIFCVYRADPEWEKRAAVITVGNDNLIREWFSDLVILAAHFELEQGSVLLEALLMRISALEKHICRSCSNDLSGAARNFLDKHYGDPDLSLEIVAHAVGVSVSHLKAVFRKRFGMGLMSYAETLRMRRAEQLLQSPYYPVAEVAHRCGYADPNYFARAFRRKYGMPPTVFRRKINGLLENG